MALWNAHVEVDTCGAEKAADRFADRMPRLPRVSGFGGVAVTTPHTLSATFDVEASDAVMAAGWASWNAEVASAGGRVVAVELREGEP